MLQSRSKMKTGETKSLGGYLLTVSTHTAMKFFVSDSVPVNTLTMSQVTGHTARMVEEICEIT